MVNISKETPGQVDSRLIKVIRKADFKVYEGTYTFEEFHLSNFNTKVNPKSLALVRDDDVWSQLVRSDNQENELFTLFSFHFDNSEDNSGFVGWLAIRLKSKLDTGVFVTCDQNSSRGSIFDYWGCPSYLGDDAIKIIRGIISKSR